MSKISVIIPVFNTELYLEEALNSLISQKGILLEIICIDNGSTDNSLSILHSYSLKNKNIIVLEQPSGSQGNARNEGLTIASGEYIGFVDSDDFVHPEMFSKLYNLAKKQSGEIAICNIELFYQQTGVRKQMLVNKFLESDNSFHISEHPWLLRNLTICNKLFSADLIRRLNLHFPPNLLHEDQFFVASALLNAKKIISTPDILYYYRKEREGSVSSNLGKHAMDIFSVMALLDEKLQKPLDTTSLVMELKISRFLQLYAATQGKYRREFFKKLKSQIVGWELHPPLMLLSAAEYRELRIIGKMGFFLSECYYVLRAFYGKLRS
jgi:glycosyltransferase involved in cell wall biosynthesis